MFLQDCAEIADFFTELVDAVGDVSLQLQGDNTVQVVDGMVHPYKGRPGPVLLGWGADQGAHLGGFASGTGERVAGDNLPFSLKPDRCDPLANSHALKVRAGWRRQECELGPVCLSGSARSLPCSYRKKLLSDRPSQLIPQTSCHRHPVALSSIESVPTAWKVKRERSQLCLLEAGESWRGFLGPCIPVIPVALASCGSLKGSC